MSNLARIVAGARARPEPVVAAALAVAGEAEALLVPSGADVRLLALLFTPAMTLPIAWAHRAPAVPIAAATAALLAEAALGGFFTQERVVPLLAFIAALYLSGRHARGRADLAAATVAAAVLAGTRILVDPAVATAPDAVMTVVAVAVPLIVGCWVRGQARLRSELAWTAERLERRRERDARNAAAEERMRIATDLQTAVAGELRDIAARATELRVRISVGDHAGAHELLTAVAATAREALADVRRVLGVLRRANSAPLLTPPGTPKASVLTPAAPSDEPVVARAIPPTARRPSPATLDRLLAGGVLAVAATELMTGTSGGERALSAVLAVALAAPLLIRREHPLPAAAGVLAAVAAQSTLLSLDGFSLGATLGVVCAAYAIGAHAGRRASLAGVAGFALAAGAHAAVFHPDAVGAALLGGVAVPWAIGRIVRGNRRLTRELRAEGTELEAGRLRDARAAVTAERMRVARELHDAVAHNISVIAIQAAGADGVMERDPARAYECAQLIEAVAGEAITELGSLAAGSPGAEAGLARIDALVRRARAGGLPVDVRVEGDPATLPAGIDLAAYRIVQEALANTSKHAGDARATVVVRYARGAVEVEIADNGDVRPSGTGLTHEDAGHGLTGMRERVSLYGGTLRAGRRAAGGFVVHARLPTARP